MQDEPIITVEVTQEDIDQGQRCSCRGCPVALALERATGISWLVDGGCIYVDWRSFQVFAVLSPEVRAFIHRFDCGKPVQPITFTLEVPE